MTASEDVRRGAREFLPFVVLAPMPGVFAFGFDGIYIGATWAREMRNLMLVSLAIFLAAWWALRSFGNAGLWSALIACSTSSRGGLQAAGAIRRCTGRRFFLIVPLVAGMERQGRSGAGTRGKFPD